MAGKQRHAAGEVVNYMAVDAYRIGEFLYWLHFSWTTALQICSALAILGYAIGWATLAALVVIVISMGLNTPLARSQNRNQTQLMVAQDALLRATTESLRNMKISKFQVFLTLNLEKQNQDYIFIQSLQSQMLYCLLSGKKRGSCNKLMKVYAQGSNQDSDCCFG